MDLRRAIDLVLADTREEAGEPTMNARDAMAVAFEADMEDITAVVEDPDMVEAFRTVYGADRTTVARAVDGLATSVPQEPVGHSDKVADQAEFRPFTGDPATQATSDDRDAARRATEDRITAAAAHLAFDDHSLAAEQLRETAGSLDDHRDMQARREQWAREDTSGEGVRAEAYWQAGASHQPGHGDQDTTQGQAGPADPWRPAPSPAADQHDTFAPRPAVSADTAARTKACVDRTNNALRACDAALAELDNTDTARAEQGRAAELARRHTAEDTAEADTGLDLGQD